MFNFERFIGQAEPPKDMKSRHFPEIPLLTYEYEFEPHQERFASSVLKYRVLTLDTEYRMQPPKDSGIQVDNSLLLTIFGTFDMLFVIDARRSIISGNWLPEIVTRFIADETIIKLGSNLEKDLSLFEVEPKNVMDINDLAWESLQNTPYAKLIKNVGNKSGLGHISMGLFGINYKPVKEKYFSKHYVEDVLRKAKSLERCWPSWKNIIFSNKEALYHWNKEYPYPNLYTNYLTLDVKMPLAYFLFFIKQKFTANLYSLELKNYYHYLELLICQYSQLVNFEHIKHYFKGLSKLHTNYCNNFRNMSRPRPPPFKVTAQMKREKRKRKHERIKALKAKSKDEQEIILKRRKANRLKKGKVYHIAKQEQSKLQLAAVTFL